MRDYKNMPEAEECAIWLRESKNGNEYLSGIVKIEGKEYKIVAFSRQKTKESQPNWYFKKKDEEKF